MRLLKLTNLWGNRDFENMGKNLEMLGFFYAFFHKLFELNSDQLGTWSTHFTSFVLNSFFLPASKSYK